MLPPCPFPSLGWEVIDWIETYLVHGPGDVEGQPIALDDERAVFILWLYAVFPKGATRNGRSVAGQRIALRTVLSRPKGWAKSELAGALVCAEALAPVRFDGWDARGKPAGRPVTYPFIRCLATEEDQSGNTYDNVVQMLTEGAAADEYKLDVGITRTFIKEAGGGEIRPSTGADASKDGGKESFAVADETHLYVQRALKSMHRTVARNTGKRKIAEPHMLDTTTAYEPGEQSVAQAAAEAFAKLDPEQAMRRHRVLYDHHEGPPVKNWDDDRELLAALRAAYGEAASFIDFQRLKALIRMPDATEAESRRYFLNQAEATERIWITPTELDAVTDKKRKLAPGEMITVGFDGARFIDSVGLVACTEDGALFHLGSWHRPEGEAGKGWEAPAREIVQTVHGIFERYKVIRFYADPPYWQEEVDSWEQRYGEVVSPWWTDRTTQMSRAVGQLRTAIKSQTVSIDTNPDLRNHLLNSRVFKVRARLDDEDEVAHVIKKERKGSPKKIDLAVAAVLAFEARGDAIKEDEFHTPDPADYRMEIIGS